MGTTLESAVVIAAVITVITMFIVVPASFCADTYSDFTEAEEEILEEDRDISQEALCTFLTGLSENYRMIYGGIRDALSDEE